jgi:hypothetical protein
VTNRSPRLFPHIVVRNLQPRTSAIPPITSTEQPSDLHSLRTWLDYDPEFHEEVLEHTLNRWTVLGILLVIGTSGAFWTGVGLLINYLLK